MEIGIAKYNGIMDGAVLFNLTDREGYTHIPRAYFNSLNHMSPAERLCALRLFCEVDKHLGKLQEGDLTDILRATYFRCDKSALFLVKKFECWIDMAYLEPEQFLMHIHRELVEFSKQLCEMEGAKDAFNHFLGSFFLLYMHIEAEKVNSMLYIYVKHLYLVLVMALFEYFSNRMKGIPFGTENGRVDVRNFLFKPSFTDLDYYKNVVFSPSARNKNEVVKKLRYANKIETHYKNVLSELIFDGGAVDLEDDDLLDYCERELFTSNLFKVAMSPFAEFPYVKENGFLELQDLAPHEWREVLESIPRKWQDSSVYKEALGERKNYTLPLKGVTATFDYAGCVKIIQFQEVLIGKRIVLLFKMRLVNDEWISGYYDTREQLFFSSYEAFFCFRLKSSRDLYDSLTNFILECYYIMVCKQGDVVPKARLAMILRDEASPLNSIARWPKQPIMSVDYELEPGEATASLNRTVFKKKGVYVEGETSRVGVTIRKLPPSWNVSDSAKANAKAYGYELLDGYTFVLPFERKKRGHYKKDA